jgi:hypothetical protein
LQVSIGVFGDQAVVAATSEEEDGQADEEAGVSQGVEEDGQAEAEAEISQGVEKDGQADAEAAADADINPEEAGTDSDGWENRGTTPEISERMLPTSEGTLGTSRTPDEVVVKTPAAVLVCEGEKLTLKGNLDSGAVIGGEKLIDDKLDANGIALYDLLSVV